jgi:prolipoprotein diacylglyceryltransferase
LLCGASADQAAVVSARLRHLMESSDNTDAFLQPALGITTRSPGSTFQGSLVGAARAGAVTVR